MFGLDTCKEERGKEGMDDEWVGLVGLIGGGLVRNVGVSLC